jgi:hypothetical protein
MALTGDRHVTPWLKILGKGAPAAPVVEVTLRRSGPELLGVKAIVSQPVSYTCLVDNLRLPPLLVCCSLGHGLEAYRVAWAATEDVLKGQHL